MCLAQGKDKKKISLLIRQSICSQIIIYRYHIQTVCSYSILSIKTIALIFTELSI